MSTWAEEALKVWAAKRLDVPVETVLSVRFEHEPAFAYSSVTFEPESNNCVVQIAGYGSRYIDNGGIEGIPALIQEVLDAYLPPEAQAMLP